MDDDVIHKCNIHDVGSFVYFFRKIHVRSAGFDGTGRVVVAQDDLGRFQNEGFLYYEAGVHLSACDASFADLDSFEDEVCIVKIDNPKLLVIQVRDKR